MRRGLIRNIANFRPSGSYAEDACHMITEIAPCVNGKVHLRPHFR